LNEFTDCQFANRDHQTGRKQSNLRIQPGRAILDFDPRRDSVTTGRGFAGETATHRGHVDGRAKIALIYTRDFGKPSE
jgi:hypothetical protein